MAWWLCFALWLSTLLVSVLGPAFVQWGLTCEVVRGDRIGLQSATNFDSFGTRRPANLRHGARVWRPGRAAFAATGVVREAVETEGMVCSRRLDPAWPHEGTECARLAVGLMDGQSRVRPVCVYFAVAARR